MKVMLNAQKAFTKLKGKYRWHICKDHAIVGLANGSHHSGLSIHELARILFGGSGNIPPRPMFVDYAREREEFLYLALRQHTTLSKKASNSPLYLADVYVDVNTDALANYVLLDIQKWVLSSDYYKTHVPNAISTIYHKDNDIPLVEKGELLNSLYGQTKKVR